MEIEAGHIERGTTRLNFRHYQDIIDQFEQVLAASVDGVEVLSMRGGQVQTKSPVVVSQSEARSLPPLVYEQLVARKILQVLFVPLLARGEVIGILAIGNRQAGRRFTPEDIRLAETVAYFRSPGQSPYVRVVASQKGSREPCRASGHAQPHHPSSQSGDRSADGPGNRGRSSTTSVRCRSGGLGDGGCYSEQPDGGD